MALVTSDCPLLHNFSDGMGTLGLETAFLGKPCLLPSFGCGESRDCARRTLSWYLSPSETCRSLVQTRVKGKGQDPGLNINFLSRAFAPASDFGFPDYLVNVLS